jgi:DNA-3-methyladenine glycosylase II
MKTKKALNHISKDPVLKKIISTLDTPKPIVSNGVYADLIKAIIYQQISTKAADKIYERFTILVDLDLQNPLRLLSVDFEELRSAGLSRQKASYVSNIADFFVKEKIKEEMWDNMDDIEIINYLTQIKGVGKWTVEMMLIFSLGRPDVFPDRDYAIQMVIKDLYELKTEKTALIKEINALAMNWSPNRTLATLYLWQWVRHLREQKS